MFVFLSSLKSKLMSYTFLRILNVNNYLHSLVDYNQLMIRTIETKLVKMITCLGNLNW